jgi:hypothetical protein
VTRAIATIGSIKCLITAISLELYWSVEDGLMHKFILFRNVRALAFRVAFGVSIYECGATRNRHSDVCPTACA